MFSQNKGQSFNSGKGYTITEKNYIIHTFWMSCGAIFMFELIEKPYDSFFSNLK